MPPTNQPISCSFPGCNEEVIFEYEPIPAAVKADTFATTKAADAENGHSVVAYLKCPKGHIRPYVVKIK